MSGPTDEGLSNDPTYPATAVIRFTDTGQLSQDITSAWNTTAGNRLTPVSPAVQEVFNSRSFITVDAPNLKIDLERGVYRVKLRAIVLTSGTTAAGQFGVAVGRTPTARVSIFEYDEADLGAAVNTHDTGERFWFNHEGLVDFTTGDDSIEVFAAERNATSIQFEIDQLFMTVERIGYIND